MTLKTSLIVKAALLVAGTSLLAGCPSVQQAQQGQKTADPKEPINTVCVVKHPLEQLQKKELIAAIEAGVQSTGLQTRVVDGGALPEDCRLCLYYGIGNAKDGKTKLFEYQAVVDGRPLVKGTGPVGEDGSIKLKAVALYAANYLKSLANPPAAQKDASRVEGAQKQNVKPAKSQAKKPAAKPAAAPKAQKPAQTQPTAVKTSAPVAEAKKESDGK